MFDCFSGIYNPFRTFLNLDSSEGGPLEEVPSLLPSSQGASFLREISPRWQSKEMLLGKRPSDSHEDVGEPPQSRQRTIAAVPPQSAVPLLRQKTDVIQSSKKVASQAQQSMSHQTGLNTVAPQPTAPQVTAPQVTVSQAIPQVHARCSAEASRTPVTVDKAMSLIPGTVHVFSNSFGLLGGLSQEEISRIQQDQHDEKEQMRAVLEKISSTSPLTAELITSFLIVMTCKPEAKRIAEEMGFSIENDLLPDCEKSADGNPDRLLSVLEVALFFVRRGNTLADQSLALAVELGLNESIAKGCLQNGATHTAKTVDLLTALRGSGLLTARKLYNGLVHTRQTDLAGALGEAWGLKKQERETDFTRDSDRNCEGLYQGLSFRDAYYFLANRSVDPKVLAAALNTVSDETLFPVFQILLVARQNSELVTVNDLVKLLYQRPLNHWRAARKVADLAQGKDEEKHLNSHYVYSLTNMIPFDRLRAIGHHLGLGSRELVFHSFRHDKNWLRGVLMLAEQKGLLTVQNLVYALRQSGESTLLKSLRDRYPEVEAISGERQQLDLPFIPDTAAVEPCSHPVSKEQLIKLPPHNWLSLGLALGVCFTELKSIEIEALNALGGCNAETCLYLLADKLVQSESQYETGHIWKALEYLQDKETLAEFPADMKVEPSTQFDGLTEHSRNNLELLRIASSMKECPKPFARQLGIDANDVSFEGPETELRWVLEIQNTCLGHSGVALEQIQSAERNCINELKGIGGKNRSRESRKSRRFVPYHKPASAAV